VAPGERSDATVRVTDRDCPDLQRLPSRTRPGDRPPVQRFRNRPLMCSGPRAALLGAVFDVQADLHGTRVRHLTSLRSLRSKCRATSPEGDGGACGDQRDWPSPREQRATASCNGRDRNGSDDGARPRGPGSEQPPRESVSDVGGETRFTVPEVKGEGARFAVKGTASSGRTRDAHPRCRQAGREACRTTRSLSAGGRLRRAGKAPGGGPFRDGRKPRRTPGSAAGRNRPARSERNKPSRWCETTRAARGRSWLFLPEGNAETCSRASDSPILDDGGAIFGNPKRGSPAGKVGPRGSGRDGRVGVKIRRGAQGMPGSMPRTRS